MIIFDLDGTLANCEHRRHFVDPKYFIVKNYLSINSSLEDVLKRNDDIKNWIPNWKAFYKACIDDKPIETTIKILQQFLLMDGMEERFNIQIWSGRCESVRDKTEQWLEKHIEIYGYDREFYGSLLKMRPIGDYTPDNKLKEQWLDEALAHGENIEFVFESDYHSIKMFRKREIFVFDCNQSGREF